MNLKQFGLRLFEARKQHNLTQEDVVKRLGKKDITAISEYEHGKRALYAVDIPDYAHALEVPIMFLFQDVATEDDMDSAILEWFHRLPNLESKRRVFRFIQDAAPHILGQDK